MQFFEGSDGINNVFSDILSITIEKKYSTIKCISANPLSTLSSNNKNLEIMAGSFFQDLNERNITIDSYLGSGILMLEALIQSSSNKDIAELSV
ncbi:MAG: hypothetical protein H6767_04955 [Candidatus Peribacteria bacterium]|nr:MAG: hypothetical protein H6767_04955 [Candidatus Peribacteria bacterium]